MFRKKLSKLVFSNTAQNRLKKSVDLRKMLKSKMKYQLRPPKQADEFMPKNLLPGWFLGGLTRLTKTPGKKCSTPVERSPRVSKAFQITNCFLSLNLKGHILVKGSSTPSIFPKDEKYSDFHLRPVTCSSIARVQKNTKNTPCLWRTCGAGIVCLWFCWFDAASKLARSRRFLRMKPRSLWSGLLWFPWWCFCWDVLVGTTIIVYVLPQNLPQVCYGPKGQAPDKCIDRRHLGRRFALPLPDVCLPVTGVADIRVKAVRRCA